MRLIVPLTLLTLLLLAASPTTARADGLVVHEWGTFTNFSGSDGVHLDFRPLVGEDLPRFVYTSARPRTGLRRVRCSCGAWPVDCRSCGGAPNPRSQKLRVVSKVRMETPVLYFYASTEQVVSVKVGFPEGRVTEWYPQAESVGSGIDWGKIRVMPRARPQYPSDKSQSHYYPARETDASPVRVCGGNGTQFEKFLFYRGVGNFALPLKLRALGGDRFELQNSGKREVRGLFMIDIRQGKLRYRYYPRAGARSELTLPSKAGSVERLAAEMVESLVAAGLYRKEAQAMLQTWRTSWFGEEGTRLLYLVPAARTDRVLPLTITPRPTRIVRVLVGRMEILTPEMERRIESLVRRLGADAYRSREGATAALKQLGRFAEPALTRVMARTRDLEVRQRVGRLLARMRRH